MRKCSVIVSLSLLLCAAAVPASANIFVPRFVDLLVCPLLWSIYGVTLIVTFPVLLGISLLEALVLRRFLNPEGQPRLVLRLFGLNALTSLAGVFVPTFGTWSWGGMALAYGITVFVEAFLLAVFWARAFRKHTFSSVLAASTAMNSLSYAVLALIIACLVYIPQMGEDRSIRAELRGLIVAEGASDLSVVDAKQGRGVLTTGSPSSNFHSLIASTDGGLLAVTNSGGLLRLVLRHGHWRQESLDADPKVTQVTAISPDGRLVCCNKPGGAAIVARDSGRVIVRLPEPDKDAVCGIFSADNRYFVWTSVRSAGRPQLIDLRTMQTAAVPASCRLSFSPKEPRLVWAEHDKILTFDCRTRARREIAVRGYISGEPCWSTDGRYLACLGHPNPYDGQAWTPEVRVFRADGTGSVTLPCEVWTSGRPSRMVWLSR